MAPTRFGEPSAAIRERVENATECKPQLPARSDLRVLKLARTIADLVGDDSIQSHHVAEALQYRPEGCGVIVNVV